VLWWWAMLINQKSSKHMSEDYNIWIYMKKIVNKLFTSRWRDSSFSRFLIFSIRESNSIEIKQNSKALLCLSFFMIIMFCSRYLQEIANSMSSCDRKHEIWTKSKYQLKRHEVNIWWVFRDFSFINCKRSYRVNAWFHWCDLTTKERIKISISESMIWWWPKKTDSYKSFFKLIWIIIWFNWKIA
jgi:hypothetical protein